MPQAYRADEDSPCRDRPDKGSPERVIDLPKRCCDDRKRTLKLPRAGNEVTATAVSPSVGPSEYGGAFFRLSAGLGYLRTDFKHDQSGTWTDSSFAGSFRGTAVTLGADVGGPVSSHLVVVGELLGSFLHDPTAATTGHPGLDSKTWGGTYGLVSFGPAVSYYFEQSCVYITGALAITRLFGKEIDGKWGVGANLGLGKEWRASTNSGIGVLVGFQAASADDTYRESATTFVPSLRLSALWYGWRRTAAQWSCDWPGGISECPRSPHGYGLARRRASYTCSAFAAAARSACTCSSIPISL